MTTCEPLQLTLQCPIPNESQNQLGVALQGQLSILRSRDCIPTIVYVEPAKSWQGLTTAVPCMMINLGGAGDPLAKVDAKIRLIKKLYGSVKSTLPWSLPQVWSKI